jgi:hypothetical protein
MSGEYGLKIFSQSIKFVKVIYKLQKEHNDSDINVSNIPGTPQKDKKGIIRL